MKTLILAAVAAFTLMAAQALASDSAKGPITLINAFVVPDGKEAEAIAFWKQAAEFMKKQPGYISTKLHQAILPDARFKLINVAKWESAEAFRKASQALRTKGGIKPVEGVIPNPSLYTVIIED